MGRGWRLRPFCCVRGQRDKPEHGLGGKGSPKNRWEPSLSGLSSPLLPLTPGFRQIFKMANPGRNNPNNETGWMRSDY